MSSPHPALHTAICDLFGVQYPIVQTGMGWVSTPELTAATANAGALGILASGTLTLAETDAAIGRTTELTGKPFGVNMRGDAPDLAERTRHSSAPNPCARLSARLATSAADWPDTSRTCTRSTYRVTVTLPRTGSQIRP